MRKFTFATRILIVIAMYLQSSAWQWWRPALVVTPTGSWKGWTVISGGDFHLFRSQPEVEFVHPVSPGGSVKFVASGVNFSIFTHFLCFFLLKLLKLGEIDGVKFLTWKSGGVKFWTNFMSVWMIFKDNLIWNYKKYKGVVSKICEMHPDLYEKR